MKSYKLADLIVYGVIALLAVVIAVDLFVLVAMAQETMSPDAEFVRQVWDAIQNFGGLNFVARCSLVIMLIISSMKVSFLRPLWTKLGKAQPWLTLGLGFLGGLADAFMGHDKFSWSVVVAYAVAGAGAGYIHDLLDTIKKVPGLGAVYVGLIDVLMEVLGGAKAKKAEEVEKLSLK